MCATIEALFSVYIVQQSQGNLWEEARLEGKQLRLGVVVLLVLVGPRFYSLGSHYPLRRPARGEVGFPIHERNKTSEKSGDREREPRVSQYWLGHIGGNRVRRGVSEAHRSVQDLIDGESNLLGWRILEQ